MVDTGALKPWSAPVAREGRVCLVSALAVIELAKRLHATEPAHSVALVTPYAAQARLLLHLARDRELTGKTGIFAPPNMPATQADTVILDTVETPGEFAWSALDDSRPDSPARPFFDSVLNSVSGRMFVVSHWRHVRDTFGTRALLRSMLGEVSQARAALSAVELVQSQSAGSLARAPGAGKVAEGTHEEQARTQSGRNQMLQDLQTAGMRISLWSPTLDLVTVERVLNALPSSLLERGAVRVVTHPHGQRNTQNAQVVEARHTCEQMGVVVEDRPNLTACLTVVDDQIVWECTFPPLGTPGRGAAMRKIASAPVARMLHDLLSAEPQTGGHQDDGGLMPYFEAASLLARSAEASSGRTPP
jgi:hypothetical protein